LINFSPANLKDFFDAAIVLQDHGVPNYAILAANPLSFVLMDTENITREGVKELVRCTANNEVDEENENAMPVVFKSIQLK